MLNTDHECAATEPIGYDLSRRHPTNMEWSSDWALSGTPDLNRLSPRTWTATNNSCSNRARSLDDANTRLRGRFHQDLTDLQLKARFDQWQCRGQRYEARLSPLQPPTAPSKAAVKPPSQNLPLLLNAPAHTEQLPPRREVGLALQ